MRNTWAEKYYWLELVLGAAHKTNIFEHEMLCFSIFLIKEKSLHDVVVRKYLLILQQSSEQKLKEQKSNVEPCNQQNYYVAFAVYVMTRCDMYLHFIWIACDVHIRQHTTNKKESVDDRASSLNHDKGAPLFRVLLRESVAL